LENRSKIAVCAITLLITWVAIWAVTH